MAATPHHRRSVRLAYLVLGFVCLGVGLVGVVLPLIPTTGPVLLAAFFFARSSERFHTWLLSHKRFGPPIRDYQAGLGISVRAKTTAVAMIIVTFAISMVLVVTSWPGRAALAALGAWIIWFILSRPTNRSGARSDVVRSGSTS